MTMSSSMAELLSAAISESYDVGKTIALTPVHYPTLTGIKETRVWKVETEAGLFCMKRHRSGKTRERALFEERFQSEMYGVTGGAYRSETLTAKPRAADAPGIEKESNRLVQRLIYSRLGDTGIEVGAERWWLEDFVDSVHYAWWQGRWNKQFCKQGGIYLAQFHQRSHELFHSKGLHNSLDDPSESRSDWSVSLSVSRELEKTISATFAWAVNRSATLASLKNENPGSFRSLKELASGVNVAPNPAGKGRGSRKDDYDDDDSDEGTYFESAYVADDAEERDLLRAFFSVHEDLQDLCFQTIQLIRHNEISATARLYIHGDYHPGNLLQGKSSRCATVDFEHVRVADCAFDLAYGMVMFCNRWPQSNKVNVPSDALSLMEPTYSEYQARSRYAPDFPDSRVIPAAMKEFRKGYESIAPHLVPDETSLRSYIALSYVLVAMWVLDQAREFGLSADLVQTLLNLLDSWREFIEQ